MEVGENRTTSGNGPRIVRIGTHALSEGSSTSLWTRLSQHKGAEKSGGGHHRGSIFRLIVGTALKSRHGFDVPTWGIGNTAPADVRSAEVELEIAVSMAIRAMPFLWIPIEDEPGRTSLRGYVERNAIALLSNWSKEPIDPPSATWLGSLCDRERVRRSGLWNQNHVDESCDPDFIRCVERLVADIRPAT
jgi:hypothetical protein